MSYAIGSLLDKTNISTKLTYISIKYAQNSLKSTLCQGNWYIAQQYLTSFR